MVLSCSSRPVCSQIAGRPRRPAVPDGPHRVANPTDFRELVALGLLRQVDTHRHEVTSAGRDAYRALKTPPDKPRTVGFQPPNS
jgi:hypothetical protein